MSFLLQSLPMTHSSPRKRQIALIGYPGVQSLDIVGPLEVLSMANRFGEAGRYEVIVASPDGGKVTCNSGLEFANSTALRDLPDRLDTILVAGGSDDALRSVSDAEVLGWLNERSL